MAMQKNQKVLVRSADGSEKELVLLGISGPTAYVCHPARYDEAVDNREFGVGVPVADIKALEAAN